MSRVTQVGDFIRFSPNLLGETVVYVHSREYMPYMPSNAVWLPSGISCSVSLNKPYDHFHAGEYIGETDETLRLLAQWRLTNV